MTRAIDTVLFDLDDTLHDDTTAYHTAVNRVAAEVAAERRIDATALAAAYVAQANRFWKTLSAEHLSVGIIESRIEMWGQALEDVGIAADAALAERCADRYGRYRAEVYELPPDARVLLETLRSRGIKIGIVTNGFAATHHEKIDLLGLRPLIDELFLADEVGRIKPDPELFRHACEVLGSTPERTAMVGDRYERDVVGARSIGCFTVLIDVHAIPIPDGAPLPDVTVDAIGDVLAVLPLAGAAGRRA